MRYFLVTYVKKADGSMDEQVFIGKKITRKDNQVCNVILDFAEEKVIRCIIEREKMESEFEQLANYFMEHYPQQITDLIVANNK